MRRCEGHISLQEFENVLGCRHVELRWPAHSSGQVVDGVGDVVTRALAQTHQGPSAGLVELRSRGILQGAVQLIERTIRACPRRVHWVPSRHAKSH